MPMPDSAGSSRNGGSPRVSVAAAPVQRSKAARAITSLRASTVSTPSFPIATTASGSRSAPGAAARSIVASKPAVGLPG